MEVTDKQLEAVIQKVWERVIEPKIERVYNVLNSVQAQYTQYSQETGRLHEEVKRLISEPRCPTCGRINKRRRT